MNREQQKSHNTKGFVAGIILIITVVLSCFVVGFVFIFRGLNIGTPFVDLQTLQIGTYIIYGGVGSLILLFPIMILLMINRRKRIMFRTMQELGSPLNQPYPTTSQALRAKRTYYCQYCGFEVRPGERKCPECGGPIKKGRI
ncbi:MAG: hypothetical protein ACTSUR_04150 [Candidatus Heimdallarchaeaceae archaeon]